MLSCEENRPNLVLSDDDGMEFPVDSLIFAKVNFVFDGDTFNSRIDGDNYSVRVLKIDCFETSINDRLREQAKKSGISVDSALTLGKTAKSFADSILRGNEVLLIRDKYAPNTDVYDRLLRIVKINGDRFDSLLIENNLVSQ